MRESITRSLFALLYDRIGAVLAGSAIRSLPWLGLALLFTFLPPDRIGPEAMLGLLGIATLAAIAIAPLLTGEVYARAAAITRSGEAPRGGRRYPLLLAWSAIQFALAYLLLIDLAMLRAPAPPGGRFVLMLAAGLAFWFWLLARLWSFYFIPLLVARGEPLGPTLRLTARLFLGNPREMLSHMLQRQLLALLLCISGLGLIFGLGGMVPIQSCLATRIALRPLGLDLAPADGPQTNDPLPEGPGLRKLWRPWT